jgi:hypothetical protein
VHGSVLTVVGQNSLPISTAIRSLRQNSSSCCRRRAVASNRPSSKTCLIMVPPNRVGDAVTRRFESSARGRACFCVLNVCTPRGQLSSSNVGVFGTGRGRNFNWPGVLGIALMRATKTISTGQPSLSQKLGQPCNVDRDPPSFVESWLR